MKPVTSESTTVASTKSSTTMKPVTATFPTDETIATTEMEPLAVCVLASCSHVTKPCLQNLKCAAELSGFFETGLPNDHFKKNLPYAISLNCISRHCAGLLVRPSRGGAGDSEDGTSTTTTTDVPDQTTAAATTTTTTDAPDQTTAAAATTTTTDVAAPPPPPSPPSPPQRALGAREAGAGHSQGQIRHTHWI